MLAKYTKTIRLSRLLVIIATTLTALVYLTLTDVARAALKDGSAKSDETKVSVLLKGNRHTAEETVDVIVTLKAARTGRLNAFLAQTGTRFRKDFAYLSSFSVSLPYSRVAELASFPEVDRLSSNEVVFSAGHVSSTTGADAGQAAASAAGHGVIDGSGVAIAILDSGIDANHAQFAPGGSRILASVDFTGEDRTDDPFGHGTFVAAAAAGGAGAGAD